ncbi:MAG: glycosyltransferase [Bacilli bacterium]|nr:glycosyltransferase [Bacilli bacterium]
MRGISVIVPVYNSEEYLEKCLKSLVNQTLKDIEVIIINDGSTDGSQSIIDNFESVYPKIIKSYNMKKNSGLGFVRNFGISKATKEYVAFVDSDDYVDEDMFEIMYNKATEDKSEIVECDFIWEFPNKNNIDSGSFYDNVKDMLIKVRVMACNKIYNISWLKKVNPQFAVGLKYEDVLFTYQYVPYVKKVSFVKEPFYHYVQRSNSLANYQTKRVADMYEILSQVLSFYKDKKIYNKYKTELEYLFIRYLLGSSYKRACKIKNNRDKKEVLNKGWKFLNDTFPNWKKNKYLNKSGLKNKYFKLMNKPLYKFNSILFKIWR